MDALARGLNLVPLSYTGSPYENGVSLGKPVTQQDSVVVNCVTHSNLMRKRQNEISALQRTLSLVESRPKRLLSTTDMDDDEEEESSGALERRANALYPRREYRIVYKTDGATEGCYVVAANELAFRSPEDTAVSHTPGVRQDPTVFTSFNNMVLDKLNPPSFVGIVDKPGDMHKGSQMLANTAVVAASGMRNAVFSNVEGLTAHAGDLAAFRWPEPPTVSKDGRVVRQKRTSAFIGTPAEKLMAQIIPLNYHETGCGNFYTQILDFLLNGEEGHKLHEYLGLVGDFVEEVLNVSDNETTATASERAETKMNEWAEILNLEDGELQLLTKKVVSKRIGDKTVAPNVKRMLDGTVKLVFLMARTLAKQQELLQKHTIGTFTANAANNTTAEILLHKAL